MSRLKIGLSILLTLSSLWGENLCFDAIERIVGAKVQTTEKLGGLTNDNYLLCFDSNQKYVLKRFNQIGQREYERDNQNRAAAIHLAPKMQLINPQTALIEYISNAKELKIDEKDLAQVAEIIAKLHYTCAPFENFFDFIKDATQQLGACTDGLSALEQQGILNAIEEFRSLREGLSPIPLVPSHNDLHKANILMEANRLQIIDWEDSSMNDPAWDICFFLLSCEVPEAWWPIFFKIYKQQMVKEDPLLIQRVKLYRPFVLIHIALFLKTFNKDPRLTDFCMNTAQTILSDAEGYRPFLARFQSKPKEISHDP